MHCFEKLVKVRHRPVWLVDIPEYMPYQLFGHTKVNGFSITDNH